MVPPNQYDLMSVLTSDRAEAGLQILLAPGPRPPQHRAPLCGARRTEEQKSHAERELPRQDHRRGWMPRARGGDRAAVGGLDGMMGQVPSWRRAPSGPPRRRTAASHRSPDKARPQEHSDVGAGSFSTEGACRWHQCPSTRGPASTPLFKPRSAPDGAVPAVIGAQSKRGPSEVMCHSPLRTCAVHFSSLGLGFITAKGNLPELPR
ncbi:uncharacterized protein LOC124522542 isoform X2 [Lynx rufus]|uniref:uncharacterized protein LOC124522542 isoform X2 n=1 Tax=Lynx rufus TaxID=61384 RepID=UPI001F1261F6|nr:uncharacterized protein LOC124522542 isoform X2 [Lynx rufus]